MGLPLAGLRIIDLTRIPVRPGRVSSSVQKRHGGRFLTEGGNAAKRRSPMTNNASNQRPTTERCCDDARGRASRKMSIREE